MNLAWSWTIGVPFIRLLVYPSFWLIDLFSPCNVYFDLFGLIIAGFLSLWTDDWQSFAWLRPFHYPALFIRCRFYGFPLKIPHGGWYYVVFVCFCFSVTSSGRFSPCYKQSSPERQQSQRDKNLKWTRLFHHIFLEECENEDTISGALCFTFFVFLFSRLDTGQ